MWTAIGEALPFATGLALSPLAVITGIILLLGDRGRTKTVAFGLGWLIAIFAIAAVAYWIVDVAEDADPDAAASGVDVVQLLFAVLFLGLAFVSWRKRSRADPGGNKLLRRLDDISVVGAFVVGLLQGLIVIKNIPLAAAAGASLGEAGLEGGAAVTGLLVFALVSTAGVLVPLAVAVVGGHRLTPSLAAAREWLEANLSPITIVILVLLGSYFLGQGLSLFG